MTEIKVDSPLVPRYGDTGGNGSDPAPMPPQAAQPQPQATAPEQAMDTPGVPTVASDPIIRWEKGICKIPLRKKVQAHGEEIEVLTLREPTALDIEQIGQPVTLNIFDTNPRPIYEPAVMAQMLSHLGTVPMSTIRKLDPRDWQNAALAIFRFFIPDRWTAG